MEYRPAKLPQNPTVEELVLYLESELRVIASALMDNILTVDMLASKFAPSRPRTGTIAYADGTLWNPGSGEGLYVYESDNAWHPLLTTVGSLVTSIAGNTGAFTLNSASGLTNLVNDLKLLQASSTQFGAVKVDNSTILAASGIISAANPLPIPITASLGADVATNNTANYFDGPSIAQGTTGARTWWVSGQVTVLDTAAANGFAAKLWDGTTVIDSGQVSTGGANFTSVIALSGFITSPAANLRISVREPGATTGKIIFNSSGNSKDSTLSAFRIA